MTLPSPPPMPCHAKDHRCCCRTARRRRTNPVATVPPCLPSCAKIHEIDTLDGIVGITPSLDLVETGCRRRCPWLDQRAHHLERTQTVHRRRYGPWPAGPLVSMLSSLALFYLFVLVGLTTRHYSTTSTIHNVRWQVCNFANFSRTNMIQVCTV